MPLYMVQPQQQQEQPQVAFPAGRAMSIMNKAPPPIRQASSSSSPPTPSPLFTSGSERGGEAAAAACSTKPLSAVSAPGASGAALQSARRSAGAASSSDARLAAAGPIPSVSIHAAAAAAAAAAEAHSAGVAVSVFGPGAGPPPTAATVATSASPGPSPPPPPPSQVLTVATTEEAAKEAQRQQILGLANALLTFCCIGNTRVTSIRQCTSSFFVLLYQRLFDCTIAGIDRSPNTAEKRRRNVMLVLEQLRQHPYSLEDIEAEEVVKLNEDHISRLIMVFVQVAEDMRQQQELQQQQQQQHQQQQQQQQAAMVASSSAMVARQDATGGQYPLPHPAHAEDFDAAKTTGGAYAPVGYRVAEVMPPPALQQADAAGMSSGGYHFHQPMDNFYVAPAPPLNGGPASGGGIMDPSGGGSPHMISGGAELGEGVSPSSVSHYLDSSVMPTDNLLEEWYRNLVYPPAGGPAEETEMMSAVDPGHVSLHGGYSQRRHPRSDRLGREAGASLTSSGSPMYGTGQQLASASPPERRLLVGRHRHHRTQLDADDIVRRFQRLEEVLDAQEQRHRKPFVDASSSPAMQEGSLAERGARESRHRRHAAPQPPSAAFDPRGGALAPTPEKRSATEVDGGALPQQEAPPSSQQQPAYSQPPPQQHHAPPRTPAHPFVSEPPLTRQERYFFAHRPQHRIDVAQRDSKIERLRSARYLGDMQQLLRQRMRREYDTQMSAMRGSLKEFIRTSKEAKIDLMRRVRDENARYRAAYATLMEAAANEAQVPARVMSRHTVQLADYYATALQHSLLVCDSLKREADRRTKNELLRYAEEVSAWQQHLLL
ncbi:conserved hypothetical protein [Leishmania major strain Friedlin]|uniref:DUF5745 domain-containing protein n=1 Tax=Leishmania major TaxID=5664 RepID=Q4QC47_LEIMA|nr:conserved hypothetical protein [Leishmania major strain Friedlin]CAG9573571.1 hypothetical_protein_-_conserved [Leishmania major strain Friedlin]CAJ04849.1 conserved hypothetical protein [Leishmania major strain Friedlin]|eukprot:XP_001683101.1 conserved hypothetical protein [Leishmania major strain Friedlin]